MKVGAKAGDVTERWAREILTAALSAAPVAVKVKPLEFTKATNGDFCASTIVGPYLIAAPRAPTHRWKLYRYAAEHHPSSYPDFESAHEAANADFASRIAPVLKSAPVSAEPQPVAWMDAQELAYIKMVTSNGAWQDYTRMVPVGGNKEGRCPIYASPPDLAARTRG